MSSEEAISASGFGGLGGTVAQAASPLAGAFSGGFGIGGMLAGAVKATAVGLATKAVVERIAPMVVDRGGISGAFPGKRLEAEARDDLSQARVARAEARKRINEAESQQLGRMTTGERNRIAAEPARRVEAEAINNDETQILDQLLRQESDLVDTLKSLETEVEANRKEAFSYRQEAESTRQAGMEKGSALDSLADEIEARQKKAESHAERYERRSNEARDAGNQTLADDLSQKAETARALAANDRSTQSEHRVQAASVRHDARQRAAELEGKAEQIEQSFSEKQAQHGRVGDELANTRQQIPEAKERSQEAVLRKLTVERERATEAEERAAESVIELRREFEEASKAFEIATRDMAESRRDIDRHSVFGAESDADKQRSAQERLVESKDRKRAAQQRRDAAEGSLNVAETTRQDSQSRRRQATEALNRESGLAEKVQSAKTAYDLARQNARGAAGRAAVSAGAARAGMAAGIATAGLALLATVAEKTASALDGMAEKADGLGAETTRAKAEAEVRDIQRQMVRANRIDSETAEFVSLQSRLVNAVEDLKAEVLRVAAQLLLPVMNEFVKQIEGFVPGVQSLEEAERLKAFEDKEAWKQALDIGGQISWLLSKLGEDEVNKNDLNVSDVIDSLRKNRPDTFDGPYQQGNPNGPQDPP